MKNTILLSLLGLICLLSQTTAQNGFVAIPLSKSSPQASTKNKAGLSNNSNIKNNVDVNVNNGLPPDSQGCPDVHIFGARETTTPPGFGTAQVLVDLVLRTIPGATSEAIVYPAAGGDEYGASVGEGIEAVVSQTSRFAARCPGTVVIMHGYSQGAQIIDDAFCGGPDLPSLDSSSGPLISRATANSTVAVILMGNPRHVAGLPFNVGNATAGGFAARPPDFRCPAFEDRIQAYCDSPDPFCSNGTDPNTHQGYGKEYGRDALAFILGKLIV